MGRNAYLTKKVQPGEIRSEATNVAKILHDADLIVAAGLRSGLLRYPPGTVTGKDGRPVPITPTTNEGKRRPIENYPCLRAYLLRQQGKTMSQIARILHCSTKVLPELLKHGQAIYERNASSLLGGSQPVSNSR